MNIEIGKIYVNQTLNYLFPCLVDHGAVFENKINSVFKLAVGIHDTLLDAADHVEGQNVYILIDAKHQPGYYKAFTDWVRIQSFYVDDYWFDANLMHARKHMFILSIPERHKQAYVHFLRSEYSKMYDREDRKRFFYDKNRRELYDILEKNESAKVAYCQKVNEAFDTDMSASEVIGECDFPLIKEENIFNCLKGERTYFNEELDKVWS